MTDEKPLIIISAIRFFQGGAIVMVNDCLQYLSQNLSDRYRIKVLVYKKKLYGVYPNIEYIEFPKARKNIFYRLYYEYFYFNKFSKKNTVHLWLSMQDSTPRVKAKIRSVYFHNALLLYKNFLSLLRLQPHIFFLYFLYKTVYTKGLRRNDFVIIQQNCLAEFLKKRYRIEEKKLLIFPPKPADYFIEKKEKNKVFTFIYPANAFAYKNYEVVFKACEILRKKTSRFTIIFTIYGNENEYIKRLKKRYDCPEIEYKGAMPQHELFDLYNRCDCMIFPSLTESWGLPLSEFSLQDKPILCADLPYAKETLNNYKKTKFFNPNNAEMLAAYMFQAINETLQFDSSDFKYTQKTIESYQDLFEKILMKD